MIFSAPLTAAGGNVSIAGLSIEAVCLNPQCSTNQTKRTLVAGTLFAVSSTARKHWSFQGPVFLDGGGVFGGFDFDSNTGTFSSISITTTGGSAMAGRTYTIKNPSIGSATTVGVVGASTIVAGTTDGLTVTLAAPDALTNAGGTLLINTITEGNCADANCTSLNALRSAYIGGFLSSDAVSGDTRVLPQIADGGGFVTTFLLTNPTGSAITCRLIFFGDNGNALPLSLNGNAAANAYTAVVPGHSTQFLSTPGTNAQVSAGWAIAENVLNLGVIAAYRLQLPGIPESEATVEAINPTAGFAMAFDETPGFDTGFALANISGSDTVAENLYFYDTNGTLIFTDSSRALGPHQHESFMFSSRYAAQLYGKKGTVRLYYGTPGTPSAPVKGLTGIGLRVNPGSTFTSLPVATATNN